MLSFYAQLSFFSAVIGLAVVLGGLIPLIFHWTRAHLPVLLSFSGGVMLAAALVHLLPESLAFGGTHVGLWILAGFVLLYMFEKFFTVHICEALSCEVHSVGIAAFVGLTIHNLTEGFALGTSMQMHAVGWIVFFSIFMHKLPNAFALTAILLHEHYRSRSIVILQALFFLAVPIGALLAQWMSATHGPVFLSAALSFSTGTFLHIALSDIIPEVHRSTGERGLVFFAFLAGVGMMTLLRYGGSWL